MTYRASHSRNGNLRWIILLKRHDSIKSGAWVVDYVEGIFLHEGFKIGEAYIILPLLFPFIRNDKSNPMVTFILPDRIVKAVGGDDAAIDDVRLSEFYDSDVHDSFHLIQALTIASGAVSCQTISLFKLSSFDLLKLQNNLPSWYSTHGS